MAGVVSRNPRESNEYLFNSVSAAGMSLITEFIVIAEKAVVRCFSSRKDCVGKIKSVIKEEMIDGVVLPLSGKTNAAMAAEVGMGLCDPDVSL